MGHQPSVRRNSVFWWFWTFFIALAGLFLIGMALLYFIPPPRGDADHPPLLVACLVPMGFVFSGSLLGIVMYRSFGQPFADVVSAMQAVAKGDLDVRLPIKGSKSMQEMANSFNSMASELALSDQQRRNLTADIAHELRNPLHVIQGNLEGMIDGVYEASPVMLESTLAETRLLARLVSDLQTLSLAEAGQLPLHPIRFPLADLLADVVTSLAVRASELGVDIRYETDANPLLFADYNRLDQSLSNLVVNALRYTPKGGQILLRSESRLGEVNITVSDTGPGIPKAELPYIFDRFWKGDRARTRDSSSGSGLGLAISWQLIRAHGGDIKATSQPGQGMTFLITLPVPPNDLSD